MKLVDILARELVEWPEGSPFAWQDYDREVRFSLARPGNFRASELAGDNVRFRFESNPKQGVTRAEWQAAVEALKAEQAAELKWPDGAEFMGTTKEGDPKVFYRNVGGDYEYRYEHEVYWSKSKGKPVHTPIIPRPTDRAVEWDGVGNPPIGVDIECTFDAWGYWRKGRVLCYGKQMIFMEQDGDSPDCRKFEGSMNPEGIKFRKVRTQEQIAAEEREKAIEEIRKDTDYILDEICASAVLAAGYRKQVSE